MGTPISIVSSISGRLRLKGESLRQAVPRERLERELLALDGVTDLRPNPGAGSVVVQYDQAACTMAEMEARISNLIGSASPSPARSIKRPSPVSGAQRRPGQRSLRMRVNRVSKMGMLTSLATSLAVTQLRPRGWKYWHAGTGWMFVACLGVHLLVYRRHLLR
ncbi:HMA2 domain-containing protein [Ectothiorhodospira lacustris]|uniref:HMA2 domain-containing protein n=1 Tax=Ectothiorhodospira lacustris TaxID=2899127 RepID=UPI001EE8CDFE|nr:hypothetical protein [Ectothiorhodospira lacustris]MCG5511484.1 hypothetical protein [Ectothiorhodospira lacustris]MCG5523266.1 hypothetical protein [Ectothiorhodospira lacustris]